MIASLSYQVWLHFSILVTCVNCADPVYYRLVSAYVGPGIHTFCWLLPYIQWILLGKYFSVVKEAKVVWTRIYLCLNAYEQRLVFALDVS